MREICNILGTAAYYAVAYTPRNPIAAVALWTYRAQLIIGTLGAIFQAYQARCQSSPLKEVGMKQAYNMLSWTPVPVWGLIKMVRNSKQEGESNTLLMLSNQELEVVKSYGKIQWIDFEQKLSSLPAVAPSSPLLLMLAEAISESNIEGGRFIVDTILGKAKNQKSPELALFRWRLTDEHRPSSLIARLMNSNLYSGHRASHVEHILPVYGKYDVVAEESLPKFLALELESAYQFGYRNNRFSISPEDPVGTIQLEDPDGLENVPMKTRLSKLLNDFKYPIPLASFSEADLSQACLDSASAKIISYGERKFIVRWDDDEPFKQLEEAYLSGKS